MQQFISRLTGVPWKHYMQAMERNVDGDLAAAEASLPVRSLTYMPDGLSRDASEFGPDLGIPHHVKLRITRACPRHA
jgi:hypothetical protein